LALIEVRGPVAAEARQAVAMLHGIVRNELRRVGYTIVDDPRAPHEGELSVSISVPSRRGQTVQWVQNGRVIGGYNVSLQLDVAVENRVIDRVSHQFRLALGAPNPADVAYVVQRLNASAPLVAFGVDMVNRRAALVEQQRVHQQAEAQAELQQWSQLCVAPCTEAKSANACDALAAWLSRERGRADAARVSEAEGVIERSRAKIEAMRDDAAWLDAKAATCIEFATDDSCAGVRAYLSSYPTGTHRPDADAALRNLLTAAQKRAGARDEQAKRVHIREVEQRREAADHAQAEDARRKREDAKRACRDGCGRKCSSVLEQAAFQACSRECLSTCN
jgi:hypothetical protein